MRGILVLALLAASACRSGPRNMDALRHGDEHLLREHYNQALGHYEIYLQDNPDDPARPKVLVLVGRCHLGAGRPGAAVRAFEESLALAPAPPLRIEATFLKAVAHRMEGDVSRALEGMRSVADAPAHEREVSILSDELNYEHALALFRSGDWKRGQERLAAVSPQGGFGDRREPRLGLDSFTVQVASFSDEGRARREAERLRATVRPLGGGNPRFLVTAGKFARFEEAQREAERLRRTGYPDAFVLP